MLKIHVHNEGVTNVNSKSLLNGVCSVTQLLARHKKTIVSDFMSAVMLLNALQLIELGFQPGKCDTDN